MLLRILLILYLSTFATSDIFPNDFIFGVSTSAYQVEGAWNTTGKGESMWDRFTHNFPEKITDGSNGDIACDSYHKYEEDISFLKDIGVQFYRLSLSWSRILPNGYTNQINQEGVEYYLTLLKLLNASGIEPVVTIYHFDLPQNLNEIGGWTNRLVVNLFGDYARLCYKLFGNYVRYWIPINEPQTTCLNGYSYGTTAPGYSLTGLATYLCAYVNVLAHAKAYHIYHDEFYESQRGKVGTVLISYWMDPNNASSEADIAAAEKAQQFGMGLFARPIYKGNWPQIVIDTIDTRSKLAGYERSRLPKFSDEEIAYINGTSDFFGLNYYSTYLVYHRNNVTDLINITSYATDIGIGLNADPDWPRSASSWLFDVPWGIRKLINWVSDQYDNPEILITENGYSDDGSTLNDTGRIHYLTGHMCNVLKARTEDNRTITGYSQWSLMDNFEWSAGYTEKFGLIFVDFDDANRTRTPKASYEWYKNVVQSKTIDCSGF